MIFTSGDTGDVGGYSIANSLRLRSSASAYLSRTTGSAGNRTTMTYSGWAKRGLLGEDRALLSSTSAGAAGRETAILRFVSTDQLRFVQNNNVGAPVVKFDTTAVFRDPSAWYHVVLQIDTTQATNTNGVKLWVNGVLQAGSFTAYTQNAQIWWTASPRGLQIGYTDAIPAYFDGYLSDVYFIDGQALTPTSFGEFNSDGVWVPKKYSGTFGANGFYLPFNDGSNLTNLCLDRSGNGNNWTATNVSLTAGATYDWVVDTPTNNYAVLNPIGKAPIEVISDGNLKSSNTNATNGSVAGTIGVNSGLWYWEVTTTTVLSSFPMAGIALASYIGFSSNGYYNGFTADSWGLYCNTGGFVNNNSVLATYSTVSSGDVLMLALDMTGGKFYMGKNGTWFNSAAPASGTGAILTSGLAGNTVFPAISDYNGTSASANFGQRPFSYTPPTGFKALGTANRGTGSITTSGSFTGNLNADGPVVWLNGNPENMTINGNAVTWGTHADKLAGGFKVRTASASYNASGTNTYTVTTTGKLFGDLAHAPNTAKGNP